MARRVFISYSHDSPEHLDRVLALANRLRAEGIDAYLDQYETAPSQGWPRWTLNEIEQADFVLVVISPVYRARFEGKEEPGRGLGVAWEGAILSQELYAGSGRNERFIPVVLDASDIDSIPVLLAGATYYDLGREQGYEGLYRRLTEQPKIEKPELGPRRHLGPLRRRSSPRTPLAWTVPYARDSGFVDRGQLLERLIAVCERGGDELLHTLTGSGGIGKTATLVELAYRVRSAFQAILWLRADSEDHLQSSLAKAALALELPVPKSAPDSGIESSLLTWLRGNDRWILVCDDIGDFDRVEELPTALKNRGLIFAASRLSPSGSPRFRVYPVGPLPLDASLSMLTSRKRPQDAEEREAAVQLARELDGVPLTIKLAAGNIGLEGISFASYSERLLATARKLEDEPLPARRNDLAAALQDDVELDGRDLAVLRLVLCSWSPCPPTSPGTSP